MRLLATTLFCAVTFTAPLAFAQAEQASDVEEVIVTGSRIKRDTFTSPMPLATITAETIKESGNVILGDALMDLPMVNANSNSQNTSSTLFNAGQARVDLRGMGASRTLVLVDSRRHVFSDAASPAVDLNMIPSLMVERIDAVPGAASAVYGSEAIAGVVNIIMKKNQDGFLFDVQGGISQQSDGAEFRAGASWGGRLLDDRLNVIVGGEYARQDSIMQADRKWAYPGIRRDTTKTPQTVVAQSKANTSPFATFQLIGGNVVGTARSVTLDVRDRTKVVRLSGPCSTATVQPSCQDDALFYSQIYNALQGETERGSIRGYAEYALTDNINVFGELSYAKAKGYGIFQPAFSSAAGGGTMPVSLKGDNAFLAGTTATAAALRAEWLAAGKTFTTGSTAQVGKFWQEFGGRNVETDRDTLRVVAGMNGEFEAFNRNISWDWYGQYGKTKGDTVSFGVPNVLKTQWATDAILVGGNVVCRATTVAATATAAAGCVPWNLIDGPSAAAIAYANAQATTSQEIKQTVLSANATADLFQLPAGPVGFAFGVEYRKEESKFVQDPLSATGALFFNAIGTRAGEYDVKDAYAELRVPLLKDVPFAHDLTFEIAGRLSDYSTIGKADQWRIALEWSPIEDIRFRANRGTAVRAPNIVELFSPQSVNFTTAANDPCDSAQFAGASASQKAARKVTCAAAIAGWAANPGDTGTNFASNFGTGRPSLKLFQGGNPDLKPEEAITNQVGVVVQPRFIPGLSMSLDWFRVELEQQIGTVPIQTLLSDLCYDSTAAFASNPFCGVINRSAVNDAGSGVKIGDVLDVKLINLNVAAVNVEGWDASVQYSFRPSDIFNGALAGQSHDLGDFNLRLDVTREYTFDLQGLPGQPFSGLANTIPNATPEWKANFAATWAVDKFRFQWQTRYIGSMAVVTPSTAVSALNPYFTDDYYTHDIRASYRLNDQISFRAGVVNLTDKNPPYLPETFTGTGTGSSNYDNRGRFFFIGASMNY